MSQGFTVFQLAIGSPLQFVPALGTSELDSMIDAYVAGPSSIKEKRATVSLEFFNYSRQTGESSLFFPVFAPVASTTNSPASSMADSGYGSGFNVSPVVSDNMWTAPATPSTRHPKASSRKASTINDFSHIPGMKIMTRDGVDVTNSASRGCKTKEQRDHAHLMRIIKACDACKRKKIRCDPSHKRRGSEAPRQTKKAKTASSGASSSAAASSAAAAIAPQLLLDPASVDLTSAAAEAPFQFDPTTLLPFDLDFNNWDQFIPVADENMVNNFNTDEFDFFINDQTMLTPSSASASASNASFSPSRAFTPGISADEISSLGSSAAAAAAPFEGGAQLPPYMNPEGHDYADFTLYSPASSFLDEEPQQLSNQQPVLWRERQSSSSSPATTNVVCEGLGGAYDGTAASVAWAGLDLQSVHPVSTELESFHGFSQHAIIHNSAGGLSGLSPLMGVGDDYSSLEPRSPRRRVVSGSVSSSVHSSVPSSVQSVVQSSVPSSSSLSPASSYIEASGFDPKSSPRQLVTATTVTTNLRTPLRSRVSTGLESSQPVLSDPALVGGNLSQKSSTVVPQSSSGLPAISRHHILDDATSRRLDGRHILETSGQQDLHGQQGLYGLSSPSKLDSRVDRASSSGLPSPTVQPVPGLKSPEKPSLRTVRPAGPPLSSREDVVVTGSVAAAGSRSSLVSRVVVSSEPSGVVSVSSSGPVRSNRAVSSGLSSSISQQHGASSYVDQRIVTAASPAALPVQTAQPAISATDSAVNRLPVSSTTVTSAPAVITTLALCAVAANLFPTRQVQKGFPVASPQSVVSAVSVLAGLLVVLGLVSALMAGFHSFDQQQQHQQTQQQQHNDQPSILSILLGTVVTVAPSYFKWASSPSTAPPRISAALDGKAVKQASSLRDRLGDL